MPSPAAREAPGVFAEALDLALDADNRDSDLGDATRQGCSGSVLLVAAIGSGAARITPGRSSNIFLNLGDAVIPSAPVGLYWAVALIAGTSAAARTAVPSIFVVFIMCL